ncbi:MAG: hypothetical protein CL770_01410 [Chloroflexi bacterium]|nr:hypothetical protein [Chloroflexota bacterium]|tara:strand:+ start:44385 stop:44969 length:585 start_codon:yes stop_codon:yes gene_type:complete
MRFVFYKKKFIPIYFLLFCLAIITLTACSGKGGKIRGVLQNSTLDGVEVPFAAWQTFEYNGTNACIVDQASSLNPIALRKGTRVEVIDEATCSQTIFNEETGESSTFSTSLSKIRFPSPTNVGNATAGAHAEGIGSFWELWTLTSNIRIIEEKLRTQARSNVQNEDKVKQRLEQREKEKAEQKAKEKAKEKAKK